MEQVSPGPECPAIIDEINEIIVQIEKNLHVPQLIKKIDVLFYIEQRMKAKVLCDQLLNSEDGNTKRVELQALRSTVRGQWRHDFTLISTPASMHDGLTVKRYEGF